jgi:hypothetical protein
MEKSVDISKNKKQIYKDYMKELQDNPVNKRSLWLNFIAFFIPIWGIFAGFFNLAKRPKRAKSLFITTVFGFIWQVALLWFCYSFLFDYLGKICITMFG